MSGPSGATPGPWRWYGNVDTKTLYLATPRNGREIVMSFGRYGMQSAKPLFPVEGRMVGAETFARFEVCPKATSRDDERVYRGDVVDLDHPNARLIAASVDLLDAARYLLAHDDADPDSGLTAQTYDEAWNLLARAVAKAEGKAP